MMLDHSLPALTLGTAKPVAPASPPPSTTDLMGQPSVSGTTVAPGGAGPAGAGNGTAAQPSFTPFLIMMGAVLLFFIFTSSLSRKRETKQRQQLITSLRKHDKVLTAGGIIATIAEVRDDEIVLKLDESNNTKMRVTPEAIQRVLKSSTAPAAGGTESNEASSNADIQVKVKPAKASV